MKLIFFSVFLLFLPSCSGIQPIRLPAFAADNTSQERQLLQRCEKSFVQGSWQFVHSIAFAMANGQGATVIGVTVLDGERLKCALMGVEGFVLFEAVLDQELVVKRALPPFDNPGFARGLMRDVQSIFVLPQGLQAEAGRLAANESVCRYRQKDGQISDVIIDENGRTRTNIYDGELRQTQSIVAGSRIPVSDAMVPETLELTTFGLNGYTLTMKLISAENI